MVREVRVIDLALREVDGGDSSTQLKVLENVLADVSGMFDSFAGEDSNILNKAVKSTENAMSDRCTVQKKFIDLFTCFRKDVLPTVVSEWESLSEEEKNKISTVNEFFVVCITSLVLQIRPRLVVRCGIHYVGVNRKLDPWGMVAIPKANLVFMG